MVTRTVPFIATLLVLTALVLAGPGVAPADEPADDAISTEAYDVEETFEVRVDDVGNVKYKDILLYDREFFDAHAASFEEYPFLLSRRYRSMEDVNEIQDFQTGMNKEAGSVTLSFREKGRAYNMEDYWIMYGFYTEPVLISGSDVTIEETSTVNSDYTLWQDLEFKTTTHVSLPAGAANVRWDGDEYAILWEMPEQTAALTADTGNFLQQNKTVWITVFAILIAGAGGVGIVVLLRSRRTPGAPATTSPTGGPGAGATSATGAAAAASGASGATAASQEESHAAATDAAPAEGAATATTGDAPAAPAAEETSSEHTTAAAATAAPEAKEAPDAEETATAPRPRFCRHCGAELEVGDEKFCTHCGKEIH